MPNSELWRFGVHLSLRQSSVPPTISKSCGLMPFQSVYLTYLVLRPVYTHRRRVVGRKGVLIENSAVDRGVSHAADEHNRH